MVLLSVLVSAVLMAQTPPRQFVFFGGERERIHAEEFLACEAIAGAQLKYTWRQLEPERDRYALQALVEDCEFLGKHGKKLWVQVQDVSFGETVPVPEYLRDAAFGGGVAAKYESPDDDPAHERPDGFVARRWDPAVQARFAKLLAAMGKELDGRIEGINLAETAIGFGTKPEHQPAGFTPARYAAAVCENLSAARAAFPKSRVIVYANFMPGEWLPWDDLGYLRSVCEHAAKVGVGLGGPDLLPFRKGQQNHCLKFVAARRAGVVAGLAVQDGNLAAIDPQTGKAVTAAELLRYAREQLRLDYVFWGTEEPYWSQQVLPLLGGMAVGDKAGAKAGGGG
jgi:hypothetical protein